MLNINSYLRLPADDLDRIVDAVGSCWERLRGQRILLTGGTGFIGKWLLGTFLHANSRYDLNAHIIVVSRRCDIFLKEFPELRNFKEIKWLTSDVRELPPKLVGECGFAIHAATDVVATNSLIEILDVCIAGTRRVLDTVSLGGSPCRLLLLSSGAVYGRTPPTVAAIPESWTGAPDPLLAASAYGEGKRVCELLCTMATEANPCLEVSIARCFSFVGPQLPLNKQFAIGNFINAAIRSEDICIQGDGTPKRSYLYAGDLAHWLWVLLFDGKNGRAYNVGGEEALSIFDLAHRVNSVLKGAGEVRVAQIPRLDVPPQIYVPSVNRIAKEFGLTPLIDLDNAIFRTARWVDQSNRGYHEQLKYR